ncbi:hypothetical protein DFJ43DRAFT_992033 [Lentinula guzmanii]|uniref:Uncharacterized protein n=1 Tax=Lentinula guzmanii TaxID=2804957 RepID=A0AA38N3U4_9AGAR|nr:hypothetical protein DFJ43DRAFT_992033 [Lentinula guzmanii]
MKPILGENTNGIANDVAEIHSIVSEACPVLPEYPDFEVRLARHRWLPLLYVCNDLMVFPADKYISLAASQSISDRAVKKAELAAALRNWRTHEIVEEAPFMWPHFTPKNSPPPEAPWAIPPDTQSIHNLSDTERSMVLQNLMTRMNFNSARHIGDLHRALCAPLNNDLEKRKALELLHIQLSKYNIDALKYVCVDLNRLPLGKLGKPVLIQALIDWVRYIVWLRLNSENDFY